MRSCIISLRRDFFQKDTAIPVCSVTVLTLGLAHASCIQKKDKTTIKIVLVVVSYPKLVVLVSKSYEHGHLPMYKCMKTRVPPKKSVCISVFFFSLSHLRVEMS